VGFSLVSCDRERVDREREAEEVQKLARVSNAMSAPEPECVLEVAVDGFGVGATREEPFEVRVVGRDGAEVLGTVEFVRRVFVVAV
jgi:hypothetical protein